MAEIVRHESVLFLLMKHKDLNFAEIIKERRRDGELRGPFSYFNLELILKLFKRGPFRF